MAGPDLSTKLACELIIKWPTLEELQRAQPQSIRSFFYARNFRRPELLDKKLATIKAAGALCTDAAILESGRRKAVRLAKQIHSLLPSIKAYEQRIAELFKSHPDAEIFKSFPGAGEALAPRLATAFGSQRARWSSRPSERDSFRVPRSAASALRRGGGGDKRGLANGRAVPSSAFRWFRVWMIRLSGRLESSAMRSTALRWRRRSHCRLRARCRRSASRRRRRRADPCDRRARLRWAEHR